MTIRKKLLMALVILLMVGSLAAGVVWHLTHHYLIDFKIYPKNAQILDLRQEQVDMAHYEKLRQKLPDCEILWNVPFQGELLPHDTREITLTYLEEGDVEQLDYLEHLEVVHAEGCTDYARLWQLRETHPTAKVEYSVTFSDGTQANWATKKVTLSNASGEDAALLQYLPKLSQVVVGGGKDIRSLEAVRGTAANLGVQFGIQMGNKVISDGEETVIVEGITDEQLKLLPLLVSMKKLHLTNPQAAAQNVRTLREQYADVNITWDVEIAGETFDDTTTEVDLSMVTVTDLAEVESRMAYLPQAEMLIFGLCGIDNPNWGNSRSKLAASAIENEDLSAYRDRVREDYKVVWTVRLGPSIALRTDKDNFMPNHFGVGRLFNDYSYNLRYCEDMVCLDIGHMTLTDISFVEFMPKLKYLILAWTEVQYIEPIRSCKNLIFLELDNSCIRDLSPLVDCTALQDLNLGNTFCDITPVCEMTWLKNLYMIFGDGGDAWKASQSLPNTRVVTNGDATVGGGWRRLPNYYDMRDMLGMYYMN